MMILLEPQKLLELLESLCLGQLCIKTKKMVYQVVVLGELLYATETWPAKQKDIRRLECFHHHCLSSILGISRVQQCVQHNSNEEVWKQFDMQTQLAMMITYRRLSGKRISPLRCSSIKV